MQHDARTDVILHRQPLFDVLRLRPGHNERQRGCRGRLKVTNGARKGRRLLEVKEPIFAARDVDRVKHSI